MSITSDIRSYADTALEQGKHVVGQAQSQFTAVTADLRTQAEKTLNIDAIRTAVEPYLAQAKQYRSSVTDRAEGLFGSVKSDKRVAKVVSTAESLTGVVVETVTERVVKPVTSLTGRGRKPAARKRSAKSPAKKPAKAATTRPAAKKSTAKKTTAKKTTAKKTTAAKKAPAKSTS
jgi:hypothetical protein